MTVKSNSFKIDTNKNFEIIDITSKINDLLDINEGIVSIFFQTFHLRNCC